MNEFGSPILAPRKAAEKDSAGESNSGAVGVRVDFSRADEGKDTCCTLGRVIPQGMQREDGSADRKASSSEEKKGEEWKTVTANMGWPRRRRGNSSGESSRGGAYRILKFC